MKQICRLVGIDRIYNSIPWLTHVLAELDALEDELAFESVSGNDEAIPSYLRDDINEPLPDLVDDKPLEVGIHIDRGVSYTTDRPFNDPGR